MKWPIEVGVWTKTYSPLFEVAGPDEEEEEEEEEEEGLCGPEEPIPVIGLDNPELGPRTESEPKPVVLIFRSAPTTCSVGVSKSIFIILYNKHLRLAHLQQTSERSVPVRVL